MNGEATTLPPGTRLGPYELAELVGAGGMGEVYRAKDTRLGRTVAVKVLPASLSQDAALRSRLEREARAVSALSHPHICTLHDVGSDGGVDFLVMEFVEGETLAGRLERGPLPLDEALRRGIEIAEALAHAHRRGIVHRDLKPGNVMLTKPGAKLLDFGLAKATGVGGNPLRSQAPTQGAATATEKGMLLGTLPYMAPEQLEGKEVDARADLFALGAVLFEMVAGRRAFEGQSPASVIAAVLASDPPILSRLRSVSPPALDRVVAGCLSKDPDTRWESAADVALLLRGVGDEGTGAAATATAPARRAWLPWGVAALLAASSLALLATRVKAPEAPVLRARLALPEAARFERAAADPEISPDGRTVVFSALASSDRTPLWVLRLASDEARPVPGTEGAAYAFWSPDSRSLGFFQDGALRRVDLAGGAPTTICPLPERDARGGSWSEAGTIVFAGGRKGTIGRVPATGGTPVSVTTLDASRHHNSHRWPRFLPDGRRFLYWGTVNSGDPAHDAIYVGSSDGARAQLVMEGVANAEYAGGQLLFVRHGDPRLFAQPFDAGRGTLSGSAVPVGEGVASGLGVSRAFFSASPEGPLVYLAQRGRFPSEIEWIDRTGARVGTLPERGLYSGARIAPDGRRVALVLEDPDQRSSAIWIVSAPGPGRTRLTFGQGAFFAPVFSPDGSRVAYSVFQPSGVTLRARASDGGGEEEVLVPPGTGGEVVPDDWSPDGRRIVMEVWDPAAGQYQLWLLDANGRHEKVKLTDSHADESDARFSPDGRFLAYASSEDGRQQVFVRSLAGPGKWQVSTNGGFEPRFRKDGRELFFRSPDGHLMAAPLSPGPSFSSGPPAPLFPALLSNVTGFYDVSPSGDRFLLDAPAAEARRVDVRVISGWRSLLPR